MALAVGDLVDPDAVDLVQAGVVELLGDHGDHRVAHRRPGHPQQPADRLLVGACCEPRDDVLQVPGVTCVVTGPRDRLHDHHPARLAGQPTDRRPQPQLGGARVDVSPPAGPAVVARPGRPAAPGAGQPSEPSGDVDHDPVVGEADPGHTGSLQGQHPVECGRGAHGRVLMVRWLRHPDPDGPDHARHASGPERCSAHPYTGLRPRSLLPGPTKTCEVPYMLITEAPLSAIS